jgi:hypothetical protein
MIVLNHKEGTQMNADKYKYLGDPAADGVRAARRENAINRNNAQKKKWVTIKNGRGKIKGYILLFWSDRGGWVSIPGQSLFREA